jgi:hypothetical protein
MTAYDGVHCLYRVSHPKALGWETAEDGEYGSKTENGQGFVLGDTNPTWVQCRNGLQRVCRFGK